MEKSAAQASIIISTRSVPSRNSAAVNITGIHTYTSIRAQAKSTVPRVFCFATQPAGVDMIIACDTAKSANCYSEEKAHEKRRKRTFGENYFIAGIAVHAAYGKDNAECDCRGGKYYHEGRIYARKLTAHTPLCIKKACIHLIRLTVMYSCMIIFVPAEKYE